MRTETKITVGLVLMWVFIAVAQFVVVFDLPKFWRVVVLCLHFSNVGYVLFLSRKVGSDFTQEWPEELR